MLVGWGGNNGSTLTASIIANKLKMQWKTRKGHQDANYFGSLVMSSTFRLGSIGTDLISVPMHDMLPLVDPNTLHLSGTDS